MRRLFLLCVCPILALICCGCSSASENTAESHNSSQITTTTTSRSETTAQFTTASSETHTTTVVTDPPEQLQGGIGGEQAANTPKPEFFSYRFQPDSFSVRLAGGTYQTVSYPISEPLLQTIDQDYFLQDYDNDGDYDLYLPAVYDDQNIAKYVVFLWDSVDESFSTEPLSDIIAN